MEKSISRDKDSSERRNSLARKERKRISDRARGAAIRTGGYLRSYRQPITFVEPENVGSYSTVEQPGPQIINQTITPRLYLLPSPFLCTRVTSRQTQDEKRETWSVVNREGF